jgi:hypothetical protein
MKWMGRVYFPGRHPENQYKLIRAIGKDLSAALSHSSGQRFSRRHDTLLWNFAHAFRSPDGAIGKASQSTAGITAGAELEAVEVGAAVTSQPGKETYQLRWWVMGGLGPLALRIFHRGLGPLAASNSKDSKKVGCAKKIIQKEERREKGSLRPSLGTPLLNDED